MTDHDNYVKHGLDILSALTAVGTITKMLPEVAALFTIIWTGIRIWESDTVQKWVNSNAK